jgi:hypothetical protein
MHNNNLLYIANTGHMWIQNLNSDQGPRCSWRLPSSLGEFRGIKISANILYLTIEDVNQLFFCHPESGTVLSRAGTFEPSSNGELPQIKNIFMFVICAIIVFRSWTRRDDMSSNGANTTVSLNGLFFVGDMSTVQMFTAEDECIQRLGGEMGSAMNQFKPVSGVCVLGDRLYVADHWNCRIDSPWFPSDQLTGEKLCIWMESIQKSFLAKRKAFDCMWLMTRMITC